MFRPALCLAASALFTLAAGPARAADPAPLRADVHAISERGVGEKIGVVTVTSEAGGTGFQLELSGVPDGKHGFHLHVNGDCGPDMQSGKMTAGLKAGAHYDPDGHASHKGPTGPGGHKGDLPAVDVSGGTTRQKVVAPRLPFAEVKGRSLVLHAGGDTYTDNPENGGGAGRIACAVLPKS